jgi:hypothetical protein
MAKQDQHDNTQDASQEIATVVDENSLANLGTEDRLSALMGGNVAVGGSTSKVVEKAQMVGVPHIIEKVTYRAGSGEWSPGIRFDYITFQAIILTEDYLAQLGVNPANFSGVKPGEAVIYNDGSTGLARQMTSRLHKAKVITVDETQGALTEKGAKGKSAYDQPREMWEKGDTAATEGITFGIADNAPPVLLPNGLRGSEYDGPNGKAVTYYEG